MKALLSSLTALVCFAGAASAADKPNFSGDWKMNVAQSNFGALPGPSSIARKITHAEPSLIIVEQQEGGLGDQTTTRKYTTDGSDMSFESGGAVVKGNAAWEGDALILTSTVDAMSVKFTDKMTLSGDGRLLISAVHISSPQGDLDIMIVFDRQ
jgi:hypothetical protein